MVQCQVVSVEEIIVEEGLEDCGVCEADFVFQVKMLRSLRWSQECGD